MGNRKGVRDVGGFLAGGHPLLLPKAALPFRAPAEMVGGCSIFRFLKHPCPSFVLNCFLYLVGGVDICKENSKVSVFEHLFPYFLRCREVSRRKRKGDIKLPFMFPLVQGTSAWRRKLTYSAIVQESGKGTRPAPS